MSRSKADFSPIPGDAVVRFENVVRRYPGVTALSGITLEVARGEFFVLLGPSGCGKTTLLRLVAGLDQPDSGRIEICGSDMTGVPAYRRPVNTVFQSYALFPHLDVEGNIGFGLRMRRLDRPMITRRVHALAELVQLEDVLARKPDELSGGQKQRVALARALVNEPEVLLLDEPLGALDFQLRQHLQADLRRLQRQLGMTFIYVTHDQTEALALADRVAIMRQGAIEQCAAPRLIYQNPRNRFVAQFLGACNLIAGTVEGRDESGIVVDTTLGKLLLTANGLATPATPGSAVTIGLRFEDLDAAPAPEAGNRVRLTVREAKFCGAETHYSLAHGTQQLQAIVRERGPAQQWQPGTEVTLALPADRLLLFAN